MPRYKISIAYDGAHFQGFQRQNNGPTVQGAIEKALTPLSTSFTPIHAASRTDTGVHALGQVAHFDLDPERPTQVILRALNARLPRAIRILNVEQVENDFHARFGAKKKIYTYTLSTSPFQSPFHRFYSLHFPFHMDFSKIDAAIALLKGTHDFASFANTKPNSSVTSTIRTLFDITYAQDNELLIFSFEGTGFLYNMVRNLMGVLLEIGQGQLSLEVLEDLLLRRTTERLYTTAPAHALCLQQIFYNLSCCG